MTTLSLCRQMYRQFAACSSERFDFSTLQQFYTTTNTAAERLPNVFHQRWKFAMSKRWATLIYEPNTAKGKKKKTQNHPRATSTGTILSQFVSKASALIGNCSAVSQHPFLHANNVHRQQNLQTRSIRPGGTARRREKFWNLRGRTRARVCRRLETTSTHI